MKPPHSPRSSVLNTFNKKQQVQQETSSSSDNYSRNNSVISVSALATNNKLKAFDESILNKKNKFDETSPQESSVSNSSHNIFAGYQINRQSQDNTVGQIHAFVQSAKKDQPEVHKTLNNFDPKVKESIVSDSAAINNILQ